MKKEETKPRSHWRWVIQIFLATVALSAVLSFASGVALADAGYAVAVAVLTLFILLGIVFDVIGVAVTAADMKPFHSMAAHREKGAREALFLLKNAEKVSSFCNDVVGDICGIVSGSTAAVIVVRLQSSLGTRSILLSIAVTALISGLTIGGKAVARRIEHAVDRDRQLDRAEVGGKMPSRFGNAFEQKAMQFFAQNLRLAARERLDVPRPFDMLQNQSNLPRYICCGVYLLTG